MKESATIIITKNAGKLEVRCEFVPCAKTKGKMKASHHAAMVAVKAVAEWAKGVTE